VGCLYCQNLGGGHSLSAQYDAIGNM